MDIIEVARVVSDRDLKGTIKAVFTNRNVVGMAVTTSVWSIVSMGWTPFWSMYMVNNLNIPIAILGVFSAISTSQNLLFQLPGGVLADRYGRKRVIVFGTIFRIISPIIYFFATSWQWIIVGAIIDGCSSVYMPAFTAIVADSLPEKRRGSGYGAYNMVTTLPSLVGPIVGGYMMETYGYSDGVRIFLVLQALISLVITVARYFVLEETVQETKTGKRPPLLPNRDMISGYPKTFNNMTIVGIIGSFSGRLVWDYTTLYALKIIAITPVQLGLITTVTGAISAVLALPGGMLSDRYGRKNNIMLGRTVSAFSQGFIALSTGYESYFAVRAFYAGGMAVGGSGMDVGGPSWNALIADILPPEKRATAIGTQGTLTALFGLPSGPIGGWLWTNISPQTPFYASMIIGLFSAVLFWFTVNEPSKIDTSLTGPPLENDNKQSGVDQPKDKVL